MVDGGGTAVRSAPWLEPEELVTRGVAELLDTDPAPADPLLLVRLDTAADQETAAAAARVAGESNRILVGVATDHVDPRLDPVVQALDLTLVPEGAATACDRVAVTDPVAEATALHRVAVANPQAATVLARLLRWSGTLPVLAALDAESHAYSMLLGGREFTRWLDQRGPRPLPPPASDQPVLVARDGDQLRITLNRPERRNAYSAELRDALVAALQVAVADTSVTTVILDGAGPLFCSGGDLDEFGTTPDPVTAHDIRTRAGAARWLHRLAHRLEVRVHGTCVGAGVELPAFAGRVVARPDTRFLLPEIRMGLIPGAGGTVSIPRRIGRWRTLYLALCGRPIDAETALAWGLVDTIAAPQ